LPNLPLVSEGVAASPRRWRAVIIGCVAAGLVSVGFGCWLALEPIHVALTAPGHWVVETRHQDVAHPEGGQIARLLVREGDRVASGDVLMTIKPLQTEEQQATLLAQLASARLPLLLLRAQQLEEAGRPEDQLLMERARADPDLMAAIEAQRSVVSARRAAIQGQLPVLDNRIRHLRDEIVGLAAQDRSRAGQIDTLRRELEMVIELLRGGHTTRPRALGLEREIARLEGERGRAVQRCVGLGW